MLASKYSALQMKLISFRDIGLNKDKLVIAVRAGKGGCKKNSTIRVIGVRVFNPLAIDMEFEQGSI